LEKVGEKRFKKSAAVDTKFRVKLNDDHWKNKKLKNIHDDLYTMFEKVLAEAKQGFADNDSGRVVIEHPSLNNSIVVPLRPLEQLDAETVMQIIEKNIDQSRRARHGFNINVGIINQPKGSGRLRITKLHGENNSLHRKQAIINIVNVDHLCMARAIAMSSAKLHTNMKPLPGHCVV